MCMPQIKGPLVRIILLGDLIEKLLIIKKKNRKILKVLSIDESP